MKILYFDAFAGICGNMILGSLIDAGVPLSHLKQELKKLKLNFEIKTKNVTRNHLKATHLEVMVKKEAYLNLPQIKEIITKSKLKKAIKEKSLQIFLKLAEAESKVHGMPIEKVHLHEVGSIDTLADIVGSVICFEYLKIDKIYISPIRLGFGKVKIKHGEFPIPAPATIELLKGFQVYGGEYEGEFTTPTGAAIVATLATPSFPTLKLKKVSYGSGTLETPIPDLLRVMIGEKEKNDFIKESLLLLETNIDDMNPEIYPYVTELLFEAGALDVFITPIIMKKGRPAHTLSVLAAIDKEEILSNIIFHETTSIGMRKIHIERKSLKRELKKDLKIAKLKGKIVNQKREYETLKKIAKKTKTPLKNLI